MIFKEITPVTGMYIQNIPVTKVYLALSLIWEISSEDPIIDQILSCYYNGYWIDEYPWTDDTPWID